MDNLIKFIGIQLIAIQMIWPFVPMFNEHEYLCLCNRKIYIKSSLQSVALGLSLYTIYNISSFKV